jgi:subtilisin
MARSAKPSRKRQASAGKAARRRESPVEEFVILPARGFVHEIMREPKFATASGLQVLSHATEGAPSSFRVLHSIQENGPKVAAMTKPAALALRLDNPELRVLPVVYFQPALGPALRAEAKPSMAKTKAKPAATVTRSGVAVMGSDGTPVAKATVVALTDFAQRIGVEAKTDAKGVASLALPPGAKVEILAVLPPAGYWSHLARDVKLAAERKIRLQALDLATPDALRQCYPAAVGAGVRGRGVTVGIVDTGVDGTHPDLKAAISGGRNLLINEDSGDWGPRPGKEGHHGTHVAGIVGGRGAAPGVAPEATLRSYRVFPAGDGGAPNYAIADAITSAIEDGCDLINLSLGGGPPDELTRDAINYAWDRGVVCIIAAGNDGRRPVAYPGAFPLAVAVSASGWKGSFPTNTTESLDVQAPYSAKNKSAFVARFSNIGPQIDLTGPGVGIVSTLPGGGYGPLSGTSMACPAVAGVTAVLLSRNLPVLNATRDKIRSEAVFKMLGEAAKPLEYGGRDYEGYGLPEL